MRGWLADKRGDEIEGRFGEIDPAGLPAGEVTVQVKWSSLNYKDALAMRGRPGVLRRFPMVPGIDLAGIAEDGSRVLATGCGLGETHWGGYANLARVPRQWIVPVPDEFSLEQAMAIGTAGFTAMQCVDALERHGLRPGGRDIVVTGAAGGVGSIAIALLAGKGYGVTASTGRVEEEPYLRGLGAAEIINRSDLSAPGVRPMETERWSGAVDTVGGETLAGVIRGLQLNGAVAACGLAGGSELSITVFPFILRGVSLLGINSVEVTLPERKRIWRLLADYLDRSLLDSLTTVIDISDIPEWSKNMLTGQVRGRVIVKVG